jgi:hypothetical protein
MTAQKMSGGCVDVVGIKENMRVGQHLSSDITEATKPRLAQ